MEHEEIMNLLEGAFLLYLFFYVFKLGDEGTKKHKPKI